MFWRYLALSFVLVFAVVGQATATDLVILSSDGTPDLKPGTVLSATDDVTIPEGGSLVVITASGLKVKMEGPFHGPMAERIGPEPSRSGAGSNVNLVNAFSKLFNSSAFSTKALGAFRSLGKPTLSDPWAFDVSKGGTVCYQSGEDLKLWRSSALQDDIVSVKGNEASVIFEMPKDELMVLWPADAPVNDATQYDLKVESGNAVSITFRAVPSDMPTRMHTAAWMSENGCEGQATLLVVNADIDKLLQGLAQSGEF